MAAAPEDLVAFRTADRRWPFLWADDTQPPARWHGAGQGPCHYLSNSPDAAWAETLRHLDVRDHDELEDLERSLWTVEMEAPAATSALAPATLTGDEATYPVCREEADRLRAAGEHGLTAPSAGLLPPGAVLIGVDEDGQHVVGSVPGVTFVVLGPPDQLRGQHAAEGGPDPGLLARVRYL